MTPTAIAAYSLPVMNVSQHTGAFVIRFETITEMNTERFRGRVEHVASGQLAHFCSRDQLMAFLELVLKQARDDEYRRIQIPPGNSPAPDQPSKGEEETRS